LGTINSVWLIKIEKAAVYSCDRYGMKLYKFIHPAKGKIFKKQLPKQPNTRNGKQKGMV